MARLWPIGLVLLALGALGAWNVVNAPRAVEDAAAVQARMDNVPMTVGPWTAFAVPQKEEHLKIAEVAAHLSRTYESGPTGPAFTVLLLYGRSGPLGAHTPEVCFKGAGFRQLGAAVKRDVPNLPAVFWTAQFQKDGTPPATSDVLWGWGDGGVWKASDNPRLDFAGRDTIYKLYVSRAVPPADGTKVAKDPTDEFLGPFLSALAAALTAKE